ncbi:uncharacterized protein K452DRAFT_319821 [Aplosporella prunicola CBS 121167]|uniref:Uncharacterized protein n=1 Tax=Aplosporella prunicola CBS 121167 TaxID=1176127 RepID=A0A6A6BAL9_9PEZI|nr:uncharacterized protein K452DRAFT_319821 [Aplosporella prunicola CBS 121167]KAF2140315.1 hypothetical protein K452DRAFT_319821 [Aplosporella prunicola CBS 121167]
MASVDDHSSKLILSRDILRRVVTILTLKGGHEDDCSMIKKQYIKPSKRYGQPVSVNDGEEYEVLKRLHELAVEYDGTLRKQGDLIASVESQQPLGFSDAMPLQSDKVVSTQAHMEDTFQVDKEVDSVQGSQSISDGQSVGSFDSCQPEVSPAPSTPQNGPGSISPRDKSDGGLPLDMPTEKRQHQHNKLGSSDSDASPPLQISNTTVSFEATITTNDGSSSKVPFSFRDMTQTLENIAAYVDWKNSASGMHCNVDFNSFISIRKFTSETSSALVVRRGLGDE